MPMAKRDGICSFSDFTLPGRNESEIFLNFAQDFLVTCAVHIKSLAAIAQAAMYDSDSTYRRTPT